MALPASGAISLSDLAAEFGVSAPFSITDFYRGGANVPDIAANSGVPTSGAISLTDFYGAEASSPADVTPNAVNWANIPSGGGSASEEGSNANQTINGIDGSITLRIEYTETGTPAALVQYDINDGGSSLVSDGGTFSISNGQTLSFTVIAFGAAGNVSGTVTVINQSDGDAVLDTFIYSVDTAGIG